jgi:hypothetical protein
MAVATILRRVISKDHLMKMQGIHHSVINTRIPRKSEGRANQEQVEFMRWIMSSGSSVSFGLHELLEEIRLIEIELECSLPVVHVPGIARIGQGTGGLSRGVWASVLHNLAHQGSLSRRIYAPLSLDCQLVNQSADVYGLPHQWRYQDWPGPGIVEDLFNTRSAWFPPPELARQ